MDIWKKCDNQATKNKKAVWVDNNYLSNILDNSQFGADEKYHIMEALKKSKNVNLVFKKIN